METCGMECRKGDPAIVARECQSFFHFGLAESEGVAGPLSVSLLSVAVSHAWSLCPYP